MRDERRFIGLPLWAWGCITAASAVEVPSLPHAWSVSIFSFFWIFDCVVVVVGAWRVARGLFAWRGLKSGLWDVSR
jgi:hypothetical protein